MTISERNPGFKFQKGYFTDFADHQKVTLDLKKFIFMDKLNKQKVEPDNLPTKKPNKRYLSEAKEKLEKNKKRTLEAVDKNKLYKLKSYLIKNGVLD